MPQLARIWWMAVICSMIRSRERVADSGVTVEVSDLAGGLSTLTFTGYRAGGGKNTARVNLDSKE